MSLLAAPLESLHDYAKTYTVDQLREQFFDLENQREKAAAVLAAVNQEIEEWQQVLSHALMLLNDVSKGNVVSKGDS